ncbi:MAG: hypothetical protein MK209_09325 [Planctomycetes bacterium]|nr:hypothetical protein [Planctomycetota bacterium]
MQLSLSIFSNSWRSLQQLQEAARELGFSGVLPVPGDLLTSLPQPLEAGVFPLLPNSVLEAPLTPRDPPLVLDAARAQAWLQSLRTQQVQYLVIEVGTLRAVGLRERGQKLLDALRTEGRNTLGAEAVEELRSAALPVLEQELEQLARFLHSLFQAVPGLRIALAVEEHPAALLTPSSLYLLRDEAGLPPFGLWYDSARAQARSALELDQPGDWLDLHAGQIAGVTLHDWAEGEDQRLVGEGEVDFRLLSEYLPRDAIRVLSAAPVYPKELLPAARDALAAAGLH